MRTSGGMTHILDRLERQDLIERLADPDDRRGVLVGLTRKGHRVFAAAAKAHLANERGML
jgi:DNA-binding MarR family transcriptional regulator